MPMIDALIAEMKHEAGLTRKLLERLPSGKADWKPHEKSMTLGRLAGHTAEMIGWGTTTIGTPELDFSAGPPIQPAQVATAEEAVALVDQGLAEFLATAPGTSDAALFEDWTLRDGEQVYFSMPRIQCLRGFVLNHMVHHRGQLTVYLRLLEVPLPGLYGPSADDPGM